MDVSAAIAGNATSPRTSVILDIEDPAGKHNNWTQFGDGVVRIDRDGPFCVISVISVIFVIPVISVLSVISVISYGYY